MLKFLKEYWIILIFVAGIVGAAYTLKAETKNTAEKVIELKKDTEKKVEEVKEEVKETDEKLEENEKVDIEQTITLKYIQQTLEALNKKIDKEIKNNNTYLEEFDWMEGLEGISTNEIPIR